MDWLRLSSRFPEHPRIMPLPDPAFRLYIVGLCYAARNETDGAIPVEVPRQRRDAERLLDSGLWQKNGDLYLIHDYGDWQPTRAELDRDRQRARERGRRWREQRRRNEEEQ